MELSSQQMALPKSGQMESYVINLDETLKSGNFPWNQLLEMGAQVAFYVAPDRVTGDTTPIPSLKLTFSPLKINGWKMKFPLGMAYFPVLC